MKRACWLHDRANLLALPVLGLGAVFGILGWVDPLKVTVLFTWYIAADFVWIAVQPDCLPSLPSVIMLHHIVTFVLLCFPLRHPQLAPYTCWDGLVEINTLFLIARRQLRMGSRLFGLLYWATFFPLRMGLYPYLLLQFYRVMQDYAWWERLTVCSCQAALVAFNAFFLWLSIQSWRRRSEERPGSGRGGRGAAPAAAAAAAGIAAAGAPLAAKLGAALPNAVRVEARAKMM